MAEVPLLAVVGPTATGKSALALALARLVGGQIVNADSMQLYRGMDIGTAKLPAAERQGVPHHLLDVWDVGRTASVADYQRLARDVVEDLRSRGIPPVLVGGSGLYVRSVIDDLDFPGTDPVVRARLEDELVRDGAVALQTRLAVVDPPAAQRIGANGRRLVRALEVIELTGEAWSARLPAYDAIYPTVQLGLDRDNAELDVRIAGRVDRMLAEGLVEEVRGLVAEGLRDGVTARQALGYAQCLALLGGDLSLDEARVQTVAATRRFVRRQRSWFRRDPRICWLAGGASVDDARSALLSAEPDLVRTIIG